MVWLSCTQMLRTLILAVCDREEASGNNLIVPTLCVGMQPVTLRATTMFDNTTSNEWNAERPERHSRAERGNDQQNANPKVGVLFSSSSV